MEIRKPSVAGTFYPANEKELKKDINTYLEKSKKTQIKNMRALILPHAGYLYSGIIAASGCNLLKQIPKKHYKIILIGPSHYIAFHGISTSKADYWETPLGKVKITKSSFNEIPYSHLHEHSLEVQIPFLQAVLNDFEVLPLLVNNIDSEELSGEIAKLIEENTIIIASSDLSHFHNYETAVKIDNIMNDAIPKLDIKTVEKCDACGLTAILTLMHLAKTKKWKARLIDYKNSGDTSGDRKRVVGYGCYAFYV